MNRRGWYEVTLGDRMSWLSAKDPTLMQPLLPKGGKGCGITQAKQGSDPKNYTTLKWVVSVGMAS